MKLVKPDLADLAVSLLEAVEREQLVKTAASTYTSERSEIGEAMRKLAQDLRSHSADVTYQDLMNFRARYAV